MHKKSNYDLIPQASNNYRFVNGFQGRIMNLKRSAGVKIQTDFKSMDEAPKVCAFCKFNLIFYFYTYRRIKELGLKAIPP